MWLFIIASYPRKRMNLVTYMFEKKKKKTVLVGIEIFKLMPNSVFIKKYFVVLKGCFYHPPSNQLHFRTRNSYPLFFFSSESTQQMSTYSLRSTASTFPQGILKSFCSRKASRRPSMVSGVICTIKPSRNQSHTSYWVCQISVCVPSSRIYY